jgi:hypothetical protein
MNTDMRPYRAVSGKRRKDKERKSWFVDGECVGMDVTCR